MGSTAGAVEVVLVHGFTQTARSWRPVEEALHAEWYRRAPARPGGAPPRPALRTVALDLPGHGSSAASRPPDLASVARELAAGAARVTSGPATWLGYSMGARPCLRLALDHPEVVGRLVLAGATPGIAGGAERAARRAADEALAARVEQIGVPAFVEEWLATPMFCHLDEDQAGRAERRANTAEGLAFALRRLGTAAEPSMWPRLCELEVPLLLVTGEHDAKFRRIAGEMAAAIRRGAAAGGSAGGRRAAGGRGAAVSLAEVPSSGHAAPFESPQALAALVVDWLLSQLG